jgi:hypothetical protein
MQNDELKADGYVRIPMYALRTIRLRHVISGVDPSIAALGTTDKPTITGYTEWVGTWERKTITVGWDWGVVRDGVVVINPDEVRSNVRLVSDEHGPIPSALSKVDMLRWIESLPWREVVRREFADPQN